MPNQTAKHTPWKEYRAYRAFQNNGPDTWVVSQHPGFGKPVIARFATEEQATLLADALSALLQARFALTFYAGWMERNSPNGETVTYPYGQAAENTARAIIARAEGRE